MQHPSVIGSHGHSQFKGKTTLIVFNLIITSKDLRIVLNHCHVHVGSECRRTADGSDYRGNQSHTVTGKQCIPWRQEQVAAFTGSTQIMDDTELRENYCRNYKFDKALHSPWCFTSMGSWDFCDIEICGKQKS